MRELLNVDIVSVTCTGTKNLPFLIVKYLINGEREGIRRMLRVNSRLQRVLLHSILDSGRVNLPNV